MKKKEKFAIKKFATQIAISFFFASVFIVIVYFGFNNKIIYYTKLLNSISVNVQEGVEDKEITYNKVSKRLTHYPSYGKQYAKIKIPSINIDLPVYYGDSLKILRHGVGQYAGSYFPGEGGTTILAAHNSDEYFKSLVDIKNGDVVTIEANYGTFKYRVVSTKVVHMDDIEEFQVRDDEEGLLMYTCYPVTRSVVGRRKHRFLVYARRIGDSDE
jgi:sortase A